MHHTLKSGQKNNYMMQTLRF